MAICNIILVQNHATAIQAVILLFFRFTMTISCLNEEGKMRIVRLLLVAVVIVPIALAKFAPVGDASELGVVSFTTEGVNLSTELMAIYLGDFDHARISPQSNLAVAVLERYLYAYGRHCDACLPADTVPITESECSKEWVETDGWGNETRSCIEWADAKSLPGWQRRQHQCRFPKS
jgi:hypothetical protein